MTLIKLKCIEMENEFKELETGNVDEVIFTYSFLFGFNHTSGQDNKTVKFLMSVLRSLLNEKFEYSYGMLDQLDHSITLDIKRAEELGLKDAGREGGQHIKRIADIIHKENENDSYDTD